MDINKEIDDFSTGMAAGLKDDPELMLDVKEEIKSHLEDSCESLKHDGKNDDESFDMAVKEFGPSVDIGQDIINANRKRMKFRGIVKLAFRMVIVPLSVILALYVSLSRINNIKYFRMLETGSEVKKEDAKALWLSEPENKIYHGNYITDLIAGNEISKIKVEMPAAEKFEPGNARYNYILAAIIMDESKETTDREKSSSPPPRTIEEIFKPAKKKVKVDDEKYTKYKETASSLEIRDKEQGTESFGSFCLVWELTRMSVFRKAAALSLIPQKQLKVQRLRVKAAIAGMILLGLCMVFAKGWDIVYGIPAAVIVVSWLLFTVIISLRGRPGDERAKPGTVARSMIPVFSVTLLALTLVCHPALELRERHIVKQNDIGYPRFTKCEGKLVESLNKEIKRILTESE